MDKDNILTENKLLKYLSALIPFTILKNKIKSSKNIAVMKDPNVKKALSKFEKSYKETQKYNKEVQDWIKKYRDEKIKKAGK